ncbi:MAG: hypothetical protein ABS43_03695 [Bordetella sp. SCN 67-23]|nr:hypothetical protein [Burkholderiales bacterium]ODS75905.1 MAG: hypothetical protein ABS43_03695 [Bordetella sp. SCN 67-23]OJW91781.1 MAG: hypothetical protein BGO71_21725 [Burkholderiales bacterium 67-32]
MKLIDNWHRCWRLTSVQAAVVLALLSLIQAEVLPLFQFAISPRVWPWLTGCLGLVIVILRVIAQPGALDPRERRRS